MQINFDNEFECPSSFINSKSKEKLKNKEEKNNRKRKATNNILNNKDKIIFENNFEKDLRKQINLQHCSPSTSTTSFNVSSKIHSNSSKVAPKDKIRVDFLNRSLDEFILTKDDLRPNSSVRLSLLNKVTFEESQQKNKINEGSIINPIELNENEEEEEKNDLINQQKSTSINSLTECCIPREFSFNSLVELRREICQKADNKLVELFKKHLLIGFFDIKHSLIQSENSVYLIKNNLILRNFFYQLIIFSFGNMGAYDLIKSENPIKYLSVYELLQLQLKKDEMEKIENFCQILIKNRNMLWDYFSIKILLNSINEEKEISECSPVLAAIPCLINGYLPEMEGLSLLLYQLANVNYDDEKLCYAEIAFALADFHLPSMDEENDEEENLNKEEQQNVFKKQNSRIERSFRSLIFPALRNRFLPNSELGENIKELTSTAKAFKHFGRC
ncbi:hypothetical protein ACQ4LE_002198 [Meloidogyne hapla]